MDASQLTRIRRSRALFGSYLSRQTGLTGGCVNRGFSIGLGVSNSTPLVVGERFTSQQEFNNIVRLSSCGPSGPANQEPIVSSDVFSPHGFVGQVSFFGTISSSGTSPITAAGLVWNTTGNPTIADHQVTLTLPVSLGQFNLIFSPDFFGTVYASTFATNSSGTVYGVVLTTIPELCIVHGTPVHVFDGITITTKPIENITYTDTIVVWNFDEGHLDVAEPLWIKKPQTSNHYILLEFDDGTELKLVGHRVFNAEAGKFTNAFDDSTPIGTTTMNWRGEAVKLIGRRTVCETVDYYNIITDYHINLFAGGILTSCRYNNIYPIVDGKFVKDVSTTVVAAQPSISDKYWSGLRLAEQTIPIERTLEYIARLETCAMDDQ